MHDGHVAAASASMVAHHMASHDGMGDAAASPAHHDHHDQRSHQCCTCLGMCCCAATVAAPVPPVALAEPRIVDVAVVTFDESATPITRVAHVLPFANGPPVVQAL
jgi:hypothetical protein